MRARHRGAARRVVPAAHLLLLAVPYALAAASTISNILPRHDTLGRLMDIHDGNVLWDGTRYVWYGMGYGNCTEEKGWVPPFDCPGIFRPEGAGCGFRLDHMLSVFTSTDLVSWRREAEALPLGSRPPGIYFRPKVIHHRARGEYVLWINYLALNHSGQTPLSAYPNATYMVGASKSSVGPFHIVNLAARTAVSGGGDFALHASADGSAYIAHNGWGNDHAVIVEQLDEAYRNALPASATPPLSPTGNEAPLLWERNGWSYLAYGATCCFCTEGAGARVLVARHPLGPWTDTRVELNPKVHLWSADHVIRSQNNFVLAVNGTGGGGDDGTTYIFTADLWGSAADGLKSHDRQFWAPLTFDDSASPPTLSPLRWIDSFSLEVGSRMRENEIYASPAAET